MGFHLGANCYKLLIREGNKANMITIIISTLIILILLEITVNYPSKSSIDPKFEILNFNRTAIEYKVSSSFYPSTLQIAVLSMRAPPPPTLSNIYIYYDPQYPLSAVDRKAAHGLIDHLSSELDMREYHTKIKAVNATALGLLLSQKKYANDLLIMPAGAFPDTVYTLDKNFVKPWIENGGKLFWIGDYFGYYSAERGQDILNYSSPKNPSLDGAASFFGKNIFIVKDVGSQTQEESKYSESLLLDYPGVARGVSLVALESVGGTILGKVDNTSTSIASVPLGNGKVVIFGGEMIGGDDQEVRVAKDMAQIIKSGVLSSSNVIATKKIKIERNSEIRGIIHLQNNKEKFASVYVFQSSSEATFFQTFLLNMSREKANLNDRIFHKQ
jgi:hypothetical protein